VKLIFSRKGFDSGWGGYPSPILPDERMISFPIPDAQGIPYKDLHVDAEHTYSEVMESLGIRGIKYPGRGEIKVAAAYAHLDPDLSPSVIARHVGWLPTFGQVDKAQAHLHGHDVGVGDLFLFYG
jgi:hypothetical protein